MEEVVHILGFGFDPKIILFGFGIGLLVGLTGMGGASLMTPLLILVFGIQPVTAIGTDIFYGAVTKTVGGYKHLKLGTVHRGLAFWLAVGSVPAAIIGVWVIEFLQNHYGDDVGTIVLGMLGGTLVVVGVATLLRSLFLAGVIQERSAMHLYRRHIIAAVVTGALTGFVIGLTSAGSGTLIAIALIAVFRLTPQRVVGTDVFHAAILLWAAGFAHWVGGNIDFALMGMILLGSLPGVWIGTALVSRVPVGVLRPLLGCVLLGSALGVLTKAGLNLPAWAILAGPAAAGAVVWLVTRNQFRKAPEPAWARTS
jgi:uncharacterized membrane protein YfcA